MLLMIFTIKMKHQCTGKKPKLNDLHSDGLDESHNPPSVSNSDPIKKSNEKSMINKEELKNALLINNHEHEQKLELGEAIHGIVIRQGVRQRSLIPEHKEALDLYMKDSVESFPANVELKPWQNELMKYIQPHDREIIWVVGKDGNEGKSWFQKYVKSVFGTRKVVSGIDIKSNSASIFRALRKCSMVAADIFLFNIGRSKNQIKYQMIEGIKDGELCNHNGQRITVKTPNVVMVFSSDAPNTTKLAKGRLKLFLIENDQLKERNI